MSLFKISFRLVPCLETICLAIARTSKFHKARKAYQKRIIEEKALAKHSMAQDLKIAQQDLFLGLEFC